ncbi:MAG: hypothetical protein ACT6QS_09015 [Flavobacteriales bacterium]
MSNKKHLETVRRFYPDALASEDAITMLLQMISDHAGYKPAQLVYADSIGSDEINSVQYPANALQMLGPFRMGGLCGYPFAGKTGMQMFAQHVPEDGAACILYAPNTGVTKDANIGAVLRSGQISYSPCSYPVHAAIAKLRARRIEPGKRSLSDHQMNIIEQILYQHENRIITAENPVLEATGIMYDAIDQKIEELVAGTKFTCRHVILAGAIFINGDYDMGSFISFKRIGILDTTTNERTELLQTLA